MKHILLAFFVCYFGFRIVCLAEPLPGTQPLTTNDDLSIQMVAGISRYLDGEIERAAAERPARWKALGVNAARELVRKRLGMADQVVSGPMEAFAPIDAAPTNHEQHVRWPVFDDVYGEGLLLTPNGESKATIIAVPDADQLPETWLLPRQLVLQGCTVLVLALVDRRDHFSGSELLGRTVNQPHREWIYRQAYEAGRTLTGYEVQKIVRALDSLGCDKAGLVGSGEGGLIALHAAALDTRFTATLVSAYFGPRERLWSEPIYRNTFGTLRDFADAELATLIAPRMLIVEHTTAPIPVSMTKRNRPSTPGEIKTPTLAEVRAEVERAGVPIMLTESLESSLPTLIKGLGLEIAVRPSPVVPESNFDNDARQRRIVRELENHTQRLLRNSDVTRNASDLWTKINDRALWPKVQQDARTMFWEQTMGKLPTDYLPPNARSRVVIENEKWTAYNVMLDVHPDIFAWGVLLMPKDLKAGERRPVVVCQHGLEGLPMDTMNEDKDSRAFGFYKAFAARLADRGFIVFSPHNPYRGEDAFRELQRKANPLGLSLFSVILAQHDVLTGWLASLPSVDPARIGFYGLSYGGKSAMRLPAALERYCLSICSGDFNEWVLKNGSTTYPSSYMFAGEYEIFEWDLAHTFNYAEMAMLIAPRPFMVERGHDDRVATSEWVGFEMGKVLRGYSKIGFAEHAQIEWFDGPHTIHGVGTFKFLHQHLDWPEPQ